MVLVKSKVELSDNGVGIAMWIYFLFAMMVSERLMAVVSPTELHRQQGLLTEVQATISKMDRQTVDSLGSKTRKSTTLAVGAQMVYPIPFLERLNFAVELELAKQKNTTEGDDNIPLTRLALVADTVDYRLVVSSRLSPQLSYRFANLWLVALRIDYLQIDRRYSPIFYRFNQSVNAKSTAYRLFPAFALQIEKGQVGLAYQGQAIDLQIDQPAKIIVHGSYPLLENLELATNYQLSFYQQLVDSYSNQSHLEAELRWQYRDLRLAGSLAHATAYHHEQVDGIAHNHFQTTASYLFANKAKVGTTFGYRFGDKQDDITSYRLAEIEVGFQGNYLF